MEMKFPQLYRQVAFLPKRDAQIALSEFTIHNKWKENARVIDIGSGDGSTTTNVLQKYLPASYNKIIGCDISAKMVEYANEKYKTNKIEFLKWDITQEIPQPLRESFDHAFSSYTLQRIKQQKRAFTNIYNTLKDGGSCLLLILGQYPVYDVFRTLSRRKKWAEDLKDVDIFVSPYHDSQVPKSDVIALMKSVGFKSIEVDVIENTHTYDDDDTFKNLVKTINPFSVLNKRWDEFMAEYFELKPDAKKVDYKLIVAKGVKLIGILS